MNGLRWLAPVATVGILLPLGPAATSSATPSVGVDVEQQSESTVDGRTYVTRQITIAPGGSTGWHWHPGQVYGVIREGTLTHDAANCSQDGVYPAGSPVTEVPGPDNVHVGRNLGPDPLVMWVTYIVPAGSPLSVDVPNPGCPFE